MKCWNKKTRGFADSDVSQQELIQMLYVQTESLNEENDMLVARLDKEWAENAMLRTVLTAESEAAASAIQEVKRQLADGETINVAVLKEIMSPVDRAKLH